MTNFKDIKLQYTCPAAPPEGINVSSTYMVNKDSKGFYFTDGNLCKYVKDDEIWLIKMFFTPIGVSWDEVSFKIESEDKNKKFSK